MRPLIPGAVLVAAVLAATPAMAEEAVGIAICDELGLVLVGIWIPQLDRPAGQ